MLEWVPRTGAGAAPAAPGPEEEAAWACLLVELELELELCVLPEAEALELFSVWAGVEGEFPMLPLLRELRRAAKLSIMVLAMREE